MRHRLQVNNVHNMCHNAIPPHTTTPLHHYRHGQANNTRHHTMFQQRRTSLILSHQRTTHLQLRMPSSSIQHQRQRAQEAMRRNTHIHANQANNITTLTSHRIRQRTRQPVHKLQLTYHLATHYRLHVIFQPNVTNKAQRFRPGRARTASHLHNGHSNNRRRHRLHRRRSRLHFSRCTVLQFSKPKGLLCPRANKFLQVHSSVHTAKTNSTR